MFNRRNKATASRSSYVPERGLVSSPTGSQRSVPLVFDDTNKPAVSLEKLPRGDKHVSLVKGFKAAEEALLKAELPGIRLDVIVMVDGSGSMGRLYRDGIVSRLLVRTLGFVLNVDADGSVPVFTYGYRNSKPVDITTANYLEAATLIKPDFGGTAMTEAFEYAVELAQESSRLVLVINITDGNPNDRLSMKNAVIKASGLPIMSLRPGRRPGGVLDELDEMPSLIEIRKDSTGDPVRDSSDNLELYRNPMGVRFIDAVDSKDLDPLAVSDADFALALADEIGACVEVMARTGTLTGVPGYSQEF